MLCFCFEKQFHLGETSTIANKKRKKKKKKKKNEITEPGLSNHPASREEGGDRPNNISTCRDPLRGEKRQSSPSFWLGAGKTAREDAGGRGKGKKKKEEEGKEK
ncbi:hypothetical protein K0M31_009637 [Melipona bicolor]|uniref:Uncharacterized protein n=1 Tax=Melipona bicolor TaxID=60889 RepID=A0AA40FP38_9HYME|nr:hypothetical protein K0M31_009637 [Melipona bicolor]